MSNTIHMQTENVEETSREVIYSATTLYDKTDELSRLSSRLGIIWEGGRSENTRNALRRVVTELRNSINALDELGYAVHREVQQWLQADHDESFFARYVREHWQDLAEDGGRIAVGAGIIGGLGTSLLRPNSITLTVPGWAKTIFGGARNAKGFVGIKPGVTVINPGNLPGVLKGVTTTAAVFDAVQTSGTQVYADYKEYGPSTRFASAAIVDTVVKGGVALVAGLAVGAAVVAVAGISAPLLVVGALVIGTWVGLGVISNQAQAVGWQAFNESGARARAIEGTNRFLDGAGNAIGSFFQNAALGVQRAFAPPIQQIVTAPAAP